jgi:hypothetical protein
MIGNGDIQQVFKTHETKYQQRAIEKDWKWTCACGQDKVLESRAACNNETHNHWAAKVTELLPTEDNVQPDVAEDQEAPFIPRDLSILSFLLREVDCDRMTMPQARAEIGRWFHGQAWPQIKEPGRVRIRRLKQISDAIAEEFSTLLGAQP